MVKKLRLFWKQVNSKQHILGTLIIIAIALCIAAPVISFMPETVQAYETQSWESTSWSYYKTAAISNKIDDYQIKLTVGNSTGGDVDCEGHAKSDFGDIRFVNLASNTEYPYWMENYTLATQATFWIKNTDNASSILLYYGNSSASTTSNGTNTFTFFDDFNNGIIDSNKWDTVNNVVEEDGLAKVVDTANSAAYLKSNETNGYHWNQNIRVRYNASLLHQSSSGVAINMRNGSANETFYFPQINAALEVNIFVLGPSGNNITIITSNYTQGTFAKWEVVRNSTTSELFYLNETLLLEETDSGYIRDEECGFTVLAYRHNSGPTAYVYMDWLFIANHTYPEPSWSSFSNEHTTGASSYSIKGLPNNIITFAGTAGTTVYCNSTGDTNEWLEINMSIGTEDNVTEIRVFMDNLNDSGEYTNASNITLYVSNSSNTTYYSFGSFLDGGSNITINQTTWNTYIVVDNPFNSTGLTNTSTSIFCIFKIAIPSGTSTDIFWSAASDTYKIYLGHYT